MNLLSILVTLALAAMLAALAVGLPVAILRNIARGQERRRLLGRDIESLRLGRMLDGLGADRTRYLHLERVADIERQMRRCTACDATEHCDQVLQQQRPLQVEAVDFCPNRDELQRNADR
jgi:hypothetical protein